ncbi:pilus (MSHA type) biogenesis protein MshL [Ruminobacter amylophilus]|nr:pilus (MSHA type) biogenesis protein MshL [Ruminobacter amylophilus]
MSRILKSAIALSLAMCVGCVYNHPQPKEAQDELALALSQAGLSDVPEDVLNELNPDNPLDEQYSIGNASRISIAANNVPASEFFARIMNQTNSSVVVHPEVSGNITLNLDNVTTDEVFDAVYRMYGYYTEKKNSVYYVYPAGIHTENIPINYLSMIRDAETKLSIVNNTVTNSDSDSSSNSSSSSSSSDSDSSSNSSSGTKVTTTAKSDFWTDLQNVLSSIVGTDEGRLVKVNPHAAVVTVRGMPEDIQNVKNYLDSIESNLHRQVVIESKILEVTLDENYAQGIDWSAITGHTFKFGSAKAFGGGSGDAIIGIMGGGLSFSAESSHFNALMNFLKTQGDVTTLSSPRITALNNQKAIMKVGTDSYFLTDISVDTSASTTTSSNYITSDVTFKPFFSGVSLDVLPQINDNNEVLMHIHPAVIDVKEDSKTVNLGGGSSAMQLPLASSQVRETDTIVKVKSGDVILIGGLMRSEVGEYVSKVPVLGDIPYLGELFTNRNNFNHKKELVILLKPVVVDGNTWKNEIGKSMDLLKKWYPNDDGEKKSSDVDFIE